MGGDLKPILSSRAIGHNQEQYQLLGGWVPFLTRTASSLHQPEQLAQYFSSSSPPLFWLPPDFHFK